MARTLDIGGDLIDVRDMIARYEELEKARDLADDAATWARDNEEDAEELATIEAALEDLKGCGGDEQWRGDWYPVTLIHARHFVEAMQEQVEDCGYIKPDGDGGLPWWIEIDWEKTAENMRQDYQMIEIDENEYWYR